VIAKNSSPPPDMDPLGGGGKDISIFHSIFDVFFFRFFFLTGMEVSRNFGLADRPIVWLPTTLKILIFRHFFRYFWRFSPKFYKKLNYDIVCQLYCPQLFYEVTNILKSSQKTF
jgi:hypothetical protein